MKNQNNVGGKFFLVFGTVGWFLVIAILVFMLPFSVLRPFDWLIFLLINISVMFCVGMVLVLDARIKKLEQQVKQQSQANTPQ